MIIRCTTQFPIDDKRTESFFSKKDLQEFVNALPDSARILTDSIIEAEWEELR